MTTPPSLVIHLTLASLCLTLALPWYVRIRRRKWGYSRRRLVVSSVGLVAVSLILVHGLLLYGFLFGFGWSNTFGDGYGPALPLLTVEFASVILFASTLRSVVTRSPWWQKAYN